MKTALVSLLIPALVLLHLFVAPCTKVEESPAIQAAHDMLVYGIPLPLPFEGSTKADAVAPRLRATYDHLSFPGAVPRSFIGPLMLAGVAQPFLSAGAVGFEHAQVLVRAVLGLANAAALMVFARALRRAYGDGVGLWWVACLAGQFHVLFYASRTLGNSFAFGPTTLAFSLLLPHPQPKLQAKRQRQALALLTFATVVFRAELALLLGSVGLDLLLTGRQTVARLVEPVALSLLMALGLSVPLDSVFWLKPVWPELWAFYHNAVLGQASNWGTEPWHYYFSSAIPRLLLNPAAWGVVIPLACVLPATKHAARGLVLPSLLFVCIYSLQPHKETRFILYVVPPLTAAAALGANYVFARRTKSLLYGAGSFVLVLSVLVSAAASLGMLLVSSLNYPGGDALNQLFAVIAREPNTGTGPTVAVHTDVLSCMTGVTLFRQNPAGLPAALYSPGSPGSIGPNNNKLVLFDKTEDGATLRDPAFWSRFDYVLAEDPAKVPGRWDVVGTVHGYAGIEVVRPGQDTDFDADVGAIPARLGGRVLGKGALVEEIKGRTRALVGGWWVGPRMEPRIRILRRVKMAEVV